MGKSERAATWLVSTCIHCSLCLLLCFIQIFLQGGALAGMFETKVDKLFVIDARRMNQRETELPNKETFFQPGDQLQNALVILMFQILCLSALLSPYNWGLRFHQSFHPPVPPFSLTVILILDISLEIQLYISIVIWLGSSEDLSYSIKRF